MSFINKKVAVTGHTGFLAGHLCDWLYAHGAQVYKLVGDVRDSATFAELDYSFDFLFNFGAPSSQILFKRSPDYGIDVTVNGMRNAIKACEQNGIKLVYPSTGLLSHGQANEYARGKQICEDLARGARCDILGVRIFGTYGPGEEKKRDFASVPFLFMREMLEGKAPVIFGDGSQKRDFIYIEDTVNSIVTLADKAGESIVDVGTGVPISFNELVAILNEELGTDITPEYIHKPGNYIDETGADPTLLNRYYKTKFDFRKGIKELISYAKSDSHYDN